MSTPDESKSGGSAEDTVVTSATGDDSSPAGGSGPGGQRAGGPPPPWQRAGARGSSESAPEGREGAAPASAPVADRRPPTGPLPTGGSAAPTAGTPATGSPRPEGPGSAQGRRTSTALIDAPTNQLSPEQLGMRTGSRPEPEPDFDAPLDDDEPLTARPSRGKVPRRASLQVKRFDPWSVLKLALVLGVALFFVWMFAVGVLYAVLDGMGVWAQLNGTYQDLTSDAGGGGGQLITAGGVFGVAAIVGVVNTILFTALASVSAFIYNISADVAGGIEVTLSERD
ncbi:DUF3566 domain-containing protein [Actinomycetospora sp. NBRC 106378]|uniref:DUF3566 domain-containing protein n=1 Tax=Actinomycetospora sp. NBRC 106378 TaxID=3032208 RepID=UPI0024A341E1|nr:DUF3566 domain-containing protein [Actinomycetospora sp. NBRC 106378]GLZ54917.1 hypothetical protein Acsp07_45340 [Actinomycetospora sp. NBRC 106378]